MAPQLIVEAEKEYRLTPEFIGPDCGTMICVDMMYDDRIPNGHLQYMDEHCDTIAAHFKALPTTAPRWIGLGGYGALELASKKYGDGDHWSTKKATPTIAMPKQQALALVRGLRARGVLKADLYIDPEDCWTVNGAISPDDMVLRSEFFKKALQPFTATAPNQPRFASRIVAFNFMRCDPAFPPELYWTVKEGIPWNSSDVQLYTGWYQPGMKVVPEDRRWMNEPEAMAKNLNGALNTLQSALRMGDAIGHLPVVHPDAGFARHLTKIATHACCAMGARMIYAHYMSDTPEATGLAIRDIMRRYK